MFPTAHGVVSQGGSIMPPPDGLGPDGTHFYVEVTIPSVAVSAAVTDFPVYLDLSLLPAAFWAHAQADGGDIRVTESDGSTRCPVDLVTINAGLQTGELHFLASSLSSVTDSVFRVYYGHGGLSQPLPTDTYGRNAVWGDYAAVWHLEEDPAGAPPQMSDATGTGHNGAAQGSMSSGASIPARLGRGLEFDYTQNVQVGDLGVSNSSPITVQAWANLTEWGARGNYTIFASGAKVLLRLDTAAKRPEFVVNDLAGAADRVLGPATVAGAWAMYHGVYDGEQLRAYTDGVGQSIAVSGSYTWERTTTYNNIGAFIDPGGHRGFEGGIDEVRIRASALSTAWIQAEALNQSNPAGFYSVGAEQAA